MWKNHFYIPHDSRSDERCCIGIELNQESNKISYCSEKSFVIFANCSESEKKLIEFRSGVLIKEDGTVCLHHEPLYLKNRVVTEILLWSI